jgi:hypothetical protein
MNTPPKGVSGMRGGWRRYAAGAGGMLALATVIVLATGWGTAVAAQITSVLVTNDAAHPVPVQEQRADAQGNVKVHEQGTANVNVTNSSLSVAEPAPITAGGGARQVPTQTNVRVGTTTATALSIRMTDGIQFVALNDEAVLGTPVEFFGSRSRRECERGADARTSRAVRRDLLHRGDARLRRLLLGQLGRRSALSRAPEGGGPRGPRPRRPLSRECRRWESNPHSPKGTGF